LIRPQSKSSNRRTWHLIYVSACLVSFRLVWSGLIIGATTHLVKRRKAIKFYNCKPFLLSCTFWPLFWLPRFGVSSGLCSLRCPKNCTASRSRSLSLSLSHTHAHSLTLSLSCATRPFSWHFSIRKRDVVYGSRHMA